MIAIESVEGIHDPISQKVAKSTDTTRRKMQAVTNLVVFFVVSGGKKQGHET